MWLFMHSNNGELRRTSVTATAFSGLALLVSVASAQPQKTNQPAPPNPPAKQGPQGQAGQPTQPGPPGQPPPPVRPPFGLPYAGLTGDQLTAFNNGLDEFEEVATVQDGLGPIFNGKSCAACHSVPAVGGSSNILVTRFGHSTGASFDPLISLGGSLLQDKAINPIGMEHVPPQANVTAFRQSTALFGLGLIEAIPDATILAGVRSTPRDGILGRAAMVVDPASGKTLVGRFGWKAQEATLLGFAGDAYLNEIGITNRLFPTENAPNGNLALLKKLDTVPDPEDVVDKSTGKAGIDRLADYMRMISPPPAAPINASTAFGAKIFLDVGCANCHTPMMKAGPSPISAISNQNVMLFSDLLLHDMGPLGDGIAQGAAGVREMKTPPLWGVGVSAPYLHDGRANDLNTAIRAHDGEAKATRDRYINLQPDQQQLLIQFLNSI